MMRGFYKHPVVDEKQNFSPERPDMPSKKTRINKAKKKVSTSTSQKSALVARVNPKRTELSAVPEALKKRGSQQFHEIVQVMEDVQAQIARKAHELHQQRGCRHGFDLEDWLEAEHQVLGEGRRP